MSNLWRGELEPLRVSKRLLRAWFDQPAIEGCWEALFRNNEYQIANLDSISNFKKISDAVQILHACHPPSIVGMSTMSSLKSILLPKQEVSQNSVEIGSSRKDELTQLCPSPISPREQTVQLLDHLQSKQVPSLVQLSVTELRNALAGQIELNVHSLLKDLAPELQRILGSQILLEGILCVNALVDVEETFASMEALDSSLKKDIEWPNQTSFSLYQERPTMDSSDDEDDFDSSRSSSHSGSNY